MFWDKHKYINALEQELQLSTSETTQHSCLWSTFPTLSSCSSYSSLPQLCPQCQRQPWAYSPLLLFKKKSSFVAAPELWMTGADWDQRWHWTAHRQPEPSIQGEGHINQRKEELTYTFRKVPNQILAGVLVRLLWRAEWSKHRVAPNCSWPVCWAHVALAGLMQHWHSAHSFASCHRDSKMSIWNVAVPAALECSTWALTAGWHRTASSPASHRNPTGSPQEPACHWLVGWQDLRWPSWVFLCSGFRELFCCLVGFERLQTDLGKRSKAGLRVVTPFYALFVKASSCRF